MNKIRAGVNLVDNTWRPSRQTCSAAIPKAQIIWRTSLSPRSGGHPFAQSWQATFSCEASKQKMKSAVDHQIKSEWIQLVNPSSTLNQPSATGDNSSENPKLLVEPALTRDVLARLDLSKYTLMEVNSKANPPICKIVSREALNQKERAKIKQKKEQQKSNRHDNVLKEIQLSWKINSHDLDHKLKTARHCFEKGYKIRVFINPLSRYQQIDPQQKDDLLATVQEKLTSFGGQNVKSETEAGKLIMEWHPIHQQE